MGRYAHRVLLMYVPRDFILVPKLFDFFETKICKRTLILKIIAFIPNLFDVCHSPFFKHIILFKYLVKFLKIILYFSLIPTHVITTLLCNLSHLDQCFNV
jgi:hypothetical protein